MMRDFLILGGGPAGLAAASYALRKHLDIVLISRDLGGKTNFTVEFPGTQSHQVLRAHELVHGFKNTVEYLRHSRKTATASSVTAAGDHFEVTMEPERAERAAPTTKTPVAGEEQSTLEARCLLLATGARPRSLGVPGERELMGRALGYSSISYSHLLAEKRVFLVGDSRRTVDDARELAWQAAEVILLLQDAGRYEAIYREQLAELSNVRVITGKRVAGFHGDEYCRAAELSSASADGATETIEADAFFVQLQPEPQSALVAHLVETDPEGRIVVDMRNRTSRPGIFAAGDVTNVGFEQILVALGEGSKAALSAYEQLIHRE
ncbi:MAG: NAD(P)/FAD-dependent oxidoreductase [Spirochaetaceae bacterium]